MIFGDKNHRLFWEKRMVFEQGGAETQQGGESLPTNKEENITVEEVENQIIKIRESTEKTIQGVFEKDEITAMEQNYFNELNIKYGELMTKIKAAKQDKDIDITNILNEFQIISTDITTRAMDFAGVTPEEVSSLLIPFLGDNPILEGMTAELHTQASKAQERVPKALNFLEEHLSDNITISDEDKNIIAENIAAAFDFSEDGKITPLSKLENTPKTPQKYLEEMGAKLDGEKIVDISQAIPSLRKISETANKIEENAAEQSYNESVPKTLEQFKEIAPKIVEHIIYIGLYPYYGNTEEKRKEAAVDFQGRANKGLIRIGDTTIRSLCEVPEALQKKRKNHIPRWGKFLGLEEGKEDAEKTQTASILSNHFDMSPKGEEPIKYYKYELGKQKEIGVEEIQKFLKEKGVELEKNKEETIDHKVVDKEEFEKAVQETGDLNQAIDTYIEYDNELKAKAKEHGETMKWIVMLIISIFKGNNILAAYDEVNERMIRKDLKKETIGEPLSDGRIPYTIEFKKGSRMPETFWKEKKERQKEIMAKKLGMLSSDIDEIIQPDKKNPRKIRVIQKRPEEGGLIGVAKQKERKELLTAHLSKGERKTLQKTRERAEQYFDIFDEGKETPKIKEMLEEIDPYGGENLLLAMVTQESAGKKDARSEVGAVGLIQIMPETADDLEKYAKKNGLYEALEEAYELDNVPHNKRNLRAAREYPRVNIVGGMIHLIQGIRLAEKRIKEDGLQVLDNEQMRHLITGGHNAGNNGYSTRLWKSRTPFPKTAKELSQGIGIFRNEGNKGKVKQNQEYIIKVDKYFRALEGKESYDALSTQEIPPEEKEEIIAFLTKHSQVPVIKKNQLEKTKDNVLKILNDIMGVEEFREKFEISSTASLAHTATDSDHFYGLAGDIVVKPTLRKEFAKENNNKRDIQRERNELARVAEFIISTHGGVEISSKVSQRLRAGKEVYAHETGGFFFYIHKPLHLHFSDRRKRENQSHYKEGVKRVV